MRVPADAGASAGKTEDAEACASRDGFVYVVGSQFGKKAGPLNAKRSWIARVSEASIENALAGGRADLEVVRFRFGLHRAINDALAGVEVLALGPLGRQAYVEATIAKGEREAKRWAGQIQPTDHPINIEAAEFRGLDTTGGDSFDAVIGDLDAVGKSATVLADHPEGAVAASEHVRFELPQDADGGVVGSKVVHHFGDIRRVEGVSVDHEGHAHYVIDEEGHVALRTLVFD